jgi:hypothetical protein
MKLLEWAMAIINFASCVTTIMFGAESTYVLGKIGYLVDFEYLLVNGQGGMVLCTMDFMP